MKIKYKLIIILILIIVAASLPLSLFILGQQEKQKLALITHQGEIHSRVLARTTYNILLMNGGDIASSMVDARDMISMLRPLANDGLVYADAVLVSSRPGLNGTILSSYANESIVKAPATRGRLAPAAVEELKRHPGSREIFFPAANGICYEFVSTGPVPDRSAICIGRLVFSQSVILAPIKKLRLLIYGAIGLAVVLVGVLGLFLGTFISRPVAVLIRGVEKIGGGDLDYRIPVRARDELGILATTFNHLAQVVKIEIDELLAANIELKRLDLLKDEFLANMTHELRTPLHGMIGIAESLIAGAAGPASAESSHDLFLIVSSGRRLAAMVNDILDFSRLKHHDISLNRRPVNMYSLTQMVKAILQPLADRKSLAIDNEIDPDSCVVSGDEDRLQQIMLNLVGNAVKFTDAGAVTIRARNDDGDPGMAVITVADTGIGIPADSVVRIFESFEQADGSASREHGGTGLGLSIVKRLVELHGGRIWVDTEPGIGSRFSFSIAGAGEYVPDRGVPDGAGLFSGLPPEGYGAEVAVIRHVPGAGGDVPDRKRVLVVDDEPVNLQVMINYLSLEGYDVTTAASGPEALDRISAGHYDLVLLDVMLPRMSGYEVCRAIRESHSLYDLPVLMLTVRNRPGDIVAGLEAGANDYLTKPVNRQELTARVNSLISLQVSVKLNNELSLIKRDIQIAHDIQNSILTHELPRINGVDIAVRYEPMTELGGDFYDIQAAGEDRLAVLMADVSGHGIPAAFICAMLKVAYSFHSSGEEDPALILNRIGATMYNYTGGQFITACYALIDFGKKKLYQSNAGHWPLLIYRRDERRILQDGENGMPIGWHQGEVYKIAEMDIRPGDRIILYTDGVLEARNSSNQMYGETRFHGLIENCRESGAAQFVDRVFDAVEEWTAGGSEKGLDDDVTITAIDFLE